MALRARAHNQLQAGKLRDLLESCALVLVYQTLGNVRSPDLASDIRSQVQKQNASDVLAVKSLKVKNTIGASATATELTSVFQANNILVGWQAAGAAATSNASAVARRSDSLEGMLGELASTSGRERGTTIHAPALEGKALAKAIDLSLRLPNSMPVALLAGFYRGQHFKVSQLQEWKSLDATKVYSELLCQIEAASEGIFHFESVLEQLTDTLDMAQPDDLLACLDTIAEGKQQQETTPAGAQAQAASS